jgi:hypothetical protein
MNRHLTQLFSGVVLASLLAPLSLSAQKAYEFRDNANAIKAYMGQDGSITVPGSSVTASAFFGDASHLTGVPAPASVPAENVTAGTFGMGEYTIGSNLQIGGSLRIVSPADGHLGYFYGAATAAEMAFVQCGPFSAGDKNCVMQNLTDNDLYISTGGAYNQWRNLRTGNGPGVFSYLINSTMTFKAARGETKAVSVLNAESNESVSISSNGTVNFPRLLLQTKYTPAYAFFESRADTVGDNKGRFLWNNPDTEGSLFMGGMYWETPAFGTAIKNLTCPDYGTYSSCLIVNKDKNSVLFSTGAGAGQWVDLRKQTGVAENNALINECVITSSYTNTSGGSLPFGTVVVRNISTGTITTLANSDMPIGAVQDPSGCANGARCKVGYSGICMVRLKDSVTCAYNTYVYNGDTAGQAQCGTSVGAAEHNREIGHPYAPQDTGIAGAVIPVQMHFN